MNCVETPAKPTPCKLVDIDPGDGFVFPNTPDVLRIRLDTCNMPLKSGRRAYATGKSGTATWAQLDEAVFPVKLGDLPWHRV